MRCKSQNDTDGVAPYTNHLIDQTSPYLLQHAHNPVEWYPWGDEALEKAEKENKLLLISIGYAACHWCHVMESECFEDPDVAAVMNANFVCIKVDREERPDIDQIYMSAVQLLTGSGGWPLNCFALPDGKPIFGGTYFPKKQWVDVLNKISDAYSTDPDKVNDYGQRLTQGVIDKEVLIKNEIPPLFSVKTLDQMVDNWRTHFDLTNGGPNRAPKFPLPNNFIFLMRYAALSNDPQVDDYVSLTLKKMAFGGIYDQIGGGFSRYSTDAHWKVPHFEKMLYDNGQLISLYSEAYSRYKNPLFKDIVYQTIAFCKRDLYAGDGIFYSSLDADSEGEEGKFYVWNDAEFRRILGNDYDVIKAYYNVGGKGLWENENNILLRDSNDIDLAKLFDISLDDLHKKVKRSNAKLLSDRTKRIPPGVDDKSLTSWNALMLMGLVDAYIAFDDPSFLEMAKKTAHFLIVSQRKPDGGLYHNFKNGKSNINGFLDDYAFTIASLNRLYEATFEEKWLIYSREFADYSIRHFYNAQSGMFFFTSDDDRALVARKIEWTDSVLPSSNASMAHGLFFLGSIYNHGEFLEISQGMLNNMQRQLPQYGSGFSHWGNLMLNQVYPFYEIAIVGKDSDKKRSEFTDFYYPNKMMLGSLHSSDIPLLEGKYVSGETLYYVCVNKSCKRPTTELQVAIDEIH